MNDALRSMVLGPSLLGVAAIVAAALTLLRVPRRRDGAALRRLTITAALAVVAQAVHFIEEGITGFHVAFPTALGLQPWPMTFFVAFNATWFVLWLVSLPGIARGVRIAFFPIWFLSIGLAGNGIVHPFLALRSGAYFPGLGTAPFVGALGAWLFVCLWRATGRAD